MFEIHCRRFEIVSELGVFGRRQKQSSAEASASPDVLLASVCPRSQQAMNYASRRREEQVLFSPVMERAAHPDDLLS